MSGRIKKRNSYRNYPIFRTYNVQNGHGLGGMFRGFLRFAAPVLKKGLLRAGKTALNIGAKTLDEVDKNNIPVKAALKKQIISTVKSIPKKVINSRQSKKSVIKPKRSQKKKRRKNKKIVDVPFNV